MIIDFERVNYLTSSSGDESKSKTGGYSDTIIHSISKKIISNYLEMYFSYISANKMNVQEKDYEIVVKTLRYNKILLDESDIREKTIDKVLN